MIDSLTIIRTVDRLGIKRERRTDKKWMSILCPAHSDDNFGNAGINLRDSSKLIGLTNCFACGFKTNLIGLVKYVKQCGSVEARKFIGVDDCNYLKNIQQRKSDKIRELEVEVDEFRFNLKVKQLNHGEHIYTIQRGYEKLFVNKFALSHCLSGYYKDYMILPINIKEIKLFEARKLREYETLKEHYGLDRDVSPNRLKLRFKQECKSRELKYRNGIVYEDGVEIKNDVLLYLLKPKVLYPKGASIISHTIFNEENLDTTKDLYVVEGTGSIPKIWSNISRNVTSLFGAEISDKQLQILNKFKKIIIIPDNDEAGDSMVWKLGTSLENVWLLPVEAEDTDGEYLQQIRNTTLIEAVRYNVKKSGFMDIIRIR